VRRSAALACICLAAAAGCGGKSHSAPKSSTPPKVQIRQNWLAFFDGKTSADQKIALLENGQKFAAAIKAGAKSPLAKKTSATVTSVTLTGANSATVVYSVLLGGAPVLKHQKGTAVRRSGVWRVSDASFCSLLALEGSAPSGCSAG
jgi:hypothetical protein